MTAKIFFLSYIFCFHLMRCTVLSLDYLCEPMSL